MDRHVRIGAPLRRQLPALRPVKHHARVGDHRAAGMRQHRVEVDLLHPGQRADHARHAAEDRAPAPRSPPAARRDSRRAGGARACATSVRAPARRSAAAARPPCRAPPRPRRRPRRTRSPGRTPGRSRRRPAPRARARSAASAARSAPSMRAPGRSARTCRIMSSNAEADHVGVLQDRRTPPTSDLCVMSGEWIFSTTGKPIFARRGDRGRLAVRRDDRRGHRQAERREQLPSPRAR